MTLASDIITRAYRRGQITAIVSSQTTLEQAEALTLLNAIIVSSLGQEIGSELSPLNIGGSYDQSSYCSTWTPMNARLVLNLAGATTLNLHPEPYEGAGLAIADAGNSLASHNLILVGNGRNIEGAATLTLSTNGDTRQWLYRGDTANWVKITDLALTDPVPFPEEFDMYFVNRLATEINPQNGVTTAPEVVASMQRAERQIRARYRKPRPRQDMPRNLLASNRGEGGLTQADFNAGRTWR